MLVRWHDMSAAEDGNERADALVPPEEEESPAAPAGGGGASAANPFGDAGSRPQPAAARSLCRGATAAADAPSEFSDAVAIQIPSQVPTSARKPYFIFGDGQNSVDLWFVDLARPEPLQFTGRGSADVAPDEPAEVTGVASYDQGEWSVIFKRPLRASAGAPFTPGDVRADRLLGLGRSRASAATGAGSPPGIPSTSSRKTSPRRSGRW